MRAPSSVQTPFTLLTRRLGPLPLINHFIHRLGLGPALERCVPVGARPLALSHATVLGLVLRSLLIEREPVYRVQEGTAEFVHELLGLGPEQFANLSDDRIGRALDRLFEADRTALVTEVVLGLGKHFGVRFDRLHNDSTSISFCGQYRAANGRKLRGHSAPAIAYGFSKDHRPDLKQLLFILTVEGTSGVPVAFRCADGNTEDSTTHLQSWNTLRAVAGGADFLYVADSKLCVFDTLITIDRAGGRFLTVLPRVRREDTSFREWLQTNTAPWELIWDRDNPRRRDGPRDRWYVYKPDLPSKEGWPVIWVWSTLLTLHQAASRDRRLAAAVEALRELKQRLAAPRGRRPKADEVDLRVAQILDQYHIARYLKVTRLQREHSVYKQQRRGRPSKDTAYRKLTKRRYDIEWSIDEAIVAYDQKSDGCYPLLTNDRSLSPAQVLAAHKAQPKIEKRFEQLKSVHEIAPVYLHNEGRIEALFTLYFFALVVQALIERELRQAMQARNIEELPLYPEQRLTRRPTTEQVLRLFAGVQCHTLHDAGGRSVQRFPAQLSPLQCQVLDLLGVDQRAYESFG
jgi:transposase